VTTTTIALTVDLTNPGQYLACCGLLELASRLDPEAVGWFNHSQFQLALNQAERISEIRTCDLERVQSQSNTSPDAADKSPPVRLGSPFGLVLDWWEDEAASRAGFKTWAGGQTVMGFIGGMRKQVAADFWRNPFGAMPIKSPKPFYFDSRISRLTSLDLGFSAEKFTTAFSPAVELLALVGLQRFRPSTVVQRERYAFATWKEPLPASIAAAVASGLIPTLIDREFQFPLVVRTGGKYKAFGPAILERSAHD
jgi:CRISPR-associated protein Csb3